MAKLRSCIYQTVNFKKDNLSGIPKNMQDMKGFFLYWWLLIITLLAGCGSSENDKRVAVNQNDFIGRYSLGWGHSPEIEVTYSNGEIYMSKYAPGENFDGSRWSKPQKCEPVSFSMLDTLFGNSWYYGVKSGIFSKELNMTIIYAEKDTVFNVKKRPYRSKFRKTISTPTGYIYLDAKWIGEASKFDKKEIDPIRDYMDDVKINGVVKFRDGFDTVVKHLGPMDSTATKKESGRTIVYCYFPGLVFYRFGNILQLRHIDFEADPNMYLTSSKGKFNSFTTLKEVSKIFPKSYKNYVGEDEPCDCHDGNFWLLVSPTFERSTEVWDFEFPPKTKRLSDIYFR